jgi:molybdate transport system ATP-binding protein
VTPALEADITAQRGALALRAHLVVRDGPLVLVGPNGAGKTSLLLAILGIVRPTGGRVALGDAVLFDGAGGVNLAPEDRGIGYVPQGYGLFPHLTVRENLELALACRRAAPADRRQRRARAEELLADLELRHLSHRRPSTLSGGERQRVALARALASAPRALLLDEPLAALDIGARRQVRSFVASYLARLAVPAIVVTHDPADAGALGHQIAVMERGAIVQLGTMAELRAAPASAFVEALVEG